MKLEFRASQETIVCERDCKGKDWDYQRLMSELIHEDRKNFYVN